MLSAFVLHRKSTQDVWSATGRQRGRLRRESSAQYFGSVNAMMSLAWGKLDWRSKSPKPDEHSSNRTKAGSASFGSKLSQSIPRRRTFADLLRIACVR